MPTMKYIFIFSCVLLAVLIGSTAQNNEPLNEFNEILLSDLPVIMTKIATKPQNLQPMLHSMAKLILVTITLAIAALSRSWIATQLKILLSTETMNKLVEYILRKFLEFLGIPEHMLT